MLIEVNKVTTVGILFFGLLALWTVAVTEVSGSKVSSEKEEGRVAFDYGEYIEKFRKKYSPVETLNKAKLFFGRTLKIFHHNVRYQTKKTPYFLGQNQFTDMTSKELERFRNEQDEEMKVVEEARQNPDLPASSSVVAMRFDQEGEHSSRLSLADLAPAEPMAPGKTIVDFMSDDDTKDMVRDVKTVLERIKSSPELTRQIEQVIEMGRRKVEAIREKEAREVESAVRENGIRVRPIPDSNNKHYDVDSIVSYGSQHRAYDDFIKNYGRFLMNDPDFFGLNLVPYDEPNQELVSETGRGSSEGDNGDDEDEEVFSSPLKALIGSMKSIYDFMELEGYDESQDQDMAPTSTEKAKDIAGKEEKESEILYDIDWRKTGCLTKPKNQRDCNACYAFATLSLMEYFHCRQTSQLTDFSSQYVVDCGSRNELRGCKGGKLTHVGQFIRKYGIELDNTYPFTAREGQCSVDEAKLEKAGYLKPQINAWQSFPSIGAWYKWLPKSPILVGISMPSDFFGFAGGIHDGSNCDQDFVHAMLLVGSGTQDGEDFWLLKNSYSEDWGEGGYFRLSKAAPMRCFHSAVVARPRFN